RAAEEAEIARASLDGVRRQIEDLEASHAPADRIAPLRRELAALEARFAPASSSGGAGGARGSASPTGARDLPDLLRSDVAQASALGPTLDAARRELARAESSLARDALRRLDLRLSRLLRRARLGRIE